MKCNPHREITVEIRTQLKTVKNTSNIFAVYLVFIKLFTSFLPETKKSLVTAIHLGFYALRHFLHSAVGGSLF